MGVGHAASGALAPDRVGACLSRLPIASTRGGCVQTMRRRFRASPRASQPKVSDLRDMADPPPPSSPVGDRPQAGIGRAAAKGVLWSTLGGVAERLVGFLSLAIVVRLMTIEEAGIAMLAASTFDVILVVSTTGFGERIIQNPTADRALQGTVFWLKMIVCSTLAVVFFAAAGPISRIFGEPRIVPLLQVMALLIVTRAIPIVPAALLARSMNYGWLTLGTLITSVASAAAGIAVAVAGFPIWALVAQFIASSVVYTIFAFICARWLPPLRFDAREAWLTIKFGMPLLASASMSALSSQASTLLIGASQPIGAVALYRIAARLFEVMSQIIVLPVQRVLLTTFSALHGDRDRIEDAFLNLLRVVAAIAFAAYALVAAQGEAIMAILFGRDWAPSGVILAILAVGVLGLVPRAFVNASLTSVARTRLVLAYTIVVTIAVVSVVSVASGFSVTAVAAAQSSVLVATLPLSLLAFHLAFRIAPWRVLGCMGLPVIAALAAAAASEAAATQMAHAWPHLHLILRVIAVGVVGAVAFAATHLVVGPRRTLQTVRGVLALIGRSGGGKMPSMPVSG